MKILQIIPAPGWYARMYNEGKENENATSQLYPLLHWALMEVPEDRSKTSRYDRHTRYAVGMIANYDSIGWMEDAEGMSNFVGYEFHPDATPVMAQIVQGGDPKETWETRLKLQRVQVKALQEHMVQGAEIVAANQEHTANTLDMLRRQREKIIANQDRDKTA